MPCAPSPDAWMKWADHLQPDTGDHAGQRYHNIPIDQSIREVSGYNDSRATSRTLSEEFEGESSYMKQALPVGLSGQCKHGWPVTSPNSTDSTLSESSQLNCPRTLANLAPKGPIRAPLSRTNVRLDPFVPWTDPASKSSKPVLRTKRKLEESERESYVETRKAHACTWCAPRKIKCSAGYCPGCRKQKISRSLCCRSSMKELKTFNEEGGLARRFVTVYGRSTKCWSRDYVDFQIGHGFGKSIKIDIWRYEVEGKIVDLFWKEPKGWQKIEHQPYGMRTKDLDPIALDTYVGKHIQILVDHLRDRATDAKTRYFVSMMDLILQYLCQCPDADLTKTLRHCVLLWGYTFLQYHALWRAEGKDGDCNRLGMDQLTRKKGDVATITAISGVFPLPRLLNQQIHACFETRMHHWDQKVLKAITDEIVSFRSKRKGRTWSQGYEADALGLYLVSWMYLSILEEVHWDANRWDKFLNVFEWPLEQKPSANMEMCSYFANILVAHFKSAMDNRPLRHMVATDMRNFQDRFPFLTEDFVKTLGADGVPLGSCRSAVFDSTDIRSLELKFSSLIV